jgi:hypothetical protein
MWSCVDTSTVNRQQLAKKGYVIFAQAQLLIYHMAVLIFLALVQTDLTQVCLRG